MNSGDIQLQLRDEKVLDHIGRYRITLRPVLDHVFFDSESSGAGNVLQRLLGARYVAARDGLPGRRRYYQLAAKGAAGRVSLERTKPIRAQTLRSLLAVLWFCNMQETRSHRLEKWELREILQEEPPPGTHCAVPGKELRLHRVMVPGGRTQPAAVLGALKQRFIESRRYPLIRQWMEDKRYGFLILAEAERAAELRSAVTKHKINRHVPVLVASVPSPQTLARAIHEHRISQGSE